MKFSLILLSCVIIAGPARAAFFTNSPDADAFVRAAATNSNYGAAGALSGVRGKCDQQFGRHRQRRIRQLYPFQHLAMATNFNAVFGAGNWAVSGASWPSRKSARPRKPFSIAAKARLKSAGSPTPTGPKARVRP